jgi:hypothetical protein
MAFKEYKRKKHRPKENPPGMQRVCAWCGKSLPGLPHQATKHISHGICLPCAEGFLLESGLDINQSFSSPATGLPHRPDTH